MNSNMLNIYYKPNILEHYNNSPHFGEIVDYDYKFENNSNVCGDDISVMLKIKDNVIENAKFTGDGCMVSMSATSIVLDYIKGKNISVLNEIDSGFIETLMGTELTPIKKNCLQLVLQVIDNLRDELKE